MTASKVVQISKEIEDARCKGNWKLIPELVRRYKKHNPKGEILAQTISAEASLSELSFNARRDITQQQRQRQQYQNGVRHDTYNNGDNNETPLLSPRLDAKQVKSLQLQLKSVIQMNDDATHEKEFAKIILARSFYECGEFNKALDMIQQLSFSKQDVISGYRSVLFLQAQVIKAISLELNGDIPLALECYKSIISIIKDITGAKDRVFTDWAEEGLYRASLLALKNDTDDAASTLEILRAYQRATASQPTIWRLEKRLTITRQSLKYLADTYHQGTYFCPEKESSGQAVFMIEAMRLRSIYETLLHASASFPRADQVNPVVLDYVDQVGDLIDLVPWPIADLRAFAESLGRATQKAFNSPRIMRQQFRTQIKLGEFKEAHYAFRSYLYLVGLTSQARDESRFHGEALATDNEGNNIPVPLIKTEEIRQMIKDRGATMDEQGHVQNGKSIASKRSVEKETTEDVLNVLLSAIKMLCEDLERGAEAVEMAEIAKNVFEMELKPKQEVSSCITLFGTRVYRAAGTAYGLLATQTMDPTMRPEYHEKALHYLEESLKINESWETYYQLALQRGETRDIGQAIQATSKALQLNPRHIPSWHLLVLLCTCPMQGDMQQAFKTCETALEKVQDIIVDYHENELNNIELGTRPGFDDLSQYVSLETTHSMLLNIIKGPADALESQKDVFASYNLIAVPDDAELQLDGLYNEGHERNRMVISGSLGNLSEAVPSSGAETESSSKPSTNGHSTPSDSYHSLREKKSIRPHVNGTSTTRNGKAESVQTEPIPSSHHRRLHPSLHLFRGRSLRKHKQNKGGHSSTSEDSTSRESKDSLFSSNGARASYPMQASVSSLQSLRSFNSTRSLNHGGGGSTLSSASASTQLTARCRLRQKRSTRILCNLWVLSASFFLSIGRVDEALKSVEEGENVDWTSNARLWCMLGKIRLAQNRLDWAITAFQKGLVCESNDIECRVGLAKAFEEQGTLEVAEGILELVTRGNGWNCAEAWFYLGEVYRKTERIERAKDCLLYALELEKTQPIQPFSVLPRIV
ncbi:hypothetical protein BDA99DRAFT_509951 [Phascolomyces articulosus]|uniref:TPR-like protein n=1 Tax=Phascolomyces articulosus TaxID=60185 RepID=A0AAD5PDT7_9FUNG|nr:hypothetical protein BDA99DRAFT_509951 [Phascolomyces articulosus]